jgi:hypothetical protein
VNHDALFKSLLKNRSILRAFFEEFLPEAARFMDFYRLEYVDKERVTLEGKKRTGDLLIKTRFRGKAACFLIHLEHQAQPAPDLAWRMLEYLILDRRDYGLPVYPIAVLSHEELDRKSRVPLLVDFPNKRVLELDFDVIDLKRLDAPEFVKTPNAASLALSCRMRVAWKYRIKLAVDFFVSLVAARLGKEERELVQKFFLAYQTFTPQEALQLDRELSKVKPEAVRQKVMQYRNPFIDVGRQQGELDLVLRLLMRRLGALPESQKKAIQKLKLSKIEALGESLLEFKSRTDLARWLKKNAS